jgi:hypothetical protein
MSAKYSDFLCIWLRKCDFLTEKLGIGRIRIRNDLFRIRILQKVPDPTGSGSRSGSGSTTLFWRYIYIICKEKKSKRNHRPIGIKVFLDIFASWYKDPDPHLWLIDPDPDPGGPKTYGSDGSESAALIWGAHLCVSCSGSRNPSWLGPGSASRSPGSGTPCRCHPHARYACVITSVILKGGDHGLNN